MRTDAGGDQAQSLSLLRLVFGRNPTWTVVRILFVVFVTVIVFKFILVPIRVTGDSMFPTYRDGQIKFVNKLAYMNKEPRRGDVVAVEFAGRQVLLLKRVIAVPGEVFQVIDGEVWINGERIEEPYTKGKIPPESGKGLGSTRRPVTLGPDEFMILGDNRVLSEGYFNRRKQIIGKVL